MSFCFITKLNYLTKCFQNQLIPKLKSTSLILINTRFNSQIIKPIELTSVNIKAEQNITENVLKRVNECQLTSPSRTFAVVQICGKQFKVTTDDVIVVEGYWPPDIGDKISLDKVLCAGGENFSLIGTPLVEPGLVNVHATVIEKNLSHTKTHFRKKRRKQYMRINFQRNERTFLRINDIGINQLKETIEC